MGAARSSALGTVRLGSLISSPMNDAASGPVSAKAIAEKKVTSLSEKPGTRPLRGNEVAEPKRQSTSPAAAMSEKVASQRVIAPMLFNHLPSSRPKTLSSVARARASSENAMKKALLFDKERAPSPPRNRAFPAAK